MLKIWKKSNIDFISGRYIFFTLSMIAIATTLFIWVQKKDSAYGIDFAGGQFQEYRFTQAVQADQVREALKKGNVEDAIIQQIEDEPTHVMIRTSKDTYDKVKAALTSAFPANPYEILRIEQVGPIVGKALRIAALWAIVCALGGILIYVGFRFKHFDFATAGVIALIHDVIIAAGGLLIMDRQIDLLVVTALLTIAGYSINDTIVIYDRVRENMGKMDKNNLAEIINVSLNQTLSRTILTTFVTSLVVVALYLYGGEVLNNFALCLLIGLISGTYSTIFIATPLVLAWQKKSKQ